MIRRSFSEHIKELEQDIVGMGQMVAQAIEGSIEALKKQDLDSAQRIIDGDERVNQKRWEIEEACITLMATQQPVATDLREIIAVLNIVTELERMGDYAEGIAKIVILHGREPQIKALVDIPQMAQKATSMLRRSLEAFVARDAKTAEAICDEDDEVDHLHDQVYRVMLTYMMENPKTITRATYMIWAAHNIERIADRVTNICERIVFLATGKMPQVKVSKY
ncbi:MAG: phosphate signaling complex protein PhoU [Phycisphaerae bacterium]|nr:phosphate signaling complex protein PhoU [Phycisphaerae bacterium]